MKILFDYQAISGQDYGGNSRLYFELIKKLRSISEVECSLLFSNNHYLNEDNYLNTLSFFPQIDFLFKSEIKNNLNKIYSTFYLLKRDYDIFHPTYYNNYFLPFLPPNKPFVLTILDFIHENYYSQKAPGLKDRTTPRKTRLIEKAERIIAISNNTKKELIEIHPNINPEKVEVIHLNHSLNLEVYKENKEISGKYSNYILFVGKRWHYKNFNKLLLSIKGYLKEKKHVKLICAGGGEFTREEVNFISGLGLESNVIHLSFSSDNDLITLYKNAKCFIFPSDYEGFGIPVLEAFACNCPALLNKRTSLPEVGGDAALYFDIDSSVSLVEKLTLLENKSFIAELVERMKERLKLFSWEISAAKHLEVYKKALNKHN